MGKTGIKTVCYICHAPVDNDIAKHFTSSDGRILCDKCSQGVEPLSKELKKKLIEIDSKDK